MENIILFDGDCNFCNKSTQFIIKHDPKAYFKFAALQSHIGRKIIKQYHIPQNIDSLILITNNQWYAKSSATFRICKRLHHISKIFYLLLIVPRPIRDFFYDILAKNRYQWFGRNNSCMIHTPEIKKRFL